MDVVARLMGTVLSWLHGSIRWDACPGDWVVSTVAAGAIIGLLPAAGGACVAVIRKRTGNQYSPLTVAVFLILGFGSAWLLPSLGFQAVARSLAAGARGLAAGGLNSAELRTLTVDFCIGRQSDLLTRGPSAVAVLLNSSSGTLPIRYVGLLALAPLLASLFVVLQSRAAFRRGPRWPRLLLSMPFLACLFAAAQTNANVVAAMWIGFVPASMAGAIMVFLLGAPRWSVLTSAPAGRHRPEGAEEESHPAAPLTRTESEAEEIAELSHVAGSSADDLPLLGSAGVSRFKRIRKLGEGGFGQVWLALDTQLGRTVALKIASNLDASNRERTYREARALAAVRHPNCVRAYDVVEDAEGLVLVMEYIEGRSLADMVQSDGTLDDVAAARLWKTMAGALSEAHSQGILHRDVKPSNVIIDNAGAAQLIDFGIAQSNGDSTLTTTGTMVGTPDFLAPEVVKGYPATAASDAWALAATVSYALTGQPPRGSKDSVIAALLVAASGHPSSELPTRSAHRNLLTAVLSPHPANRPTLPVVQEELTRWLSRAGLDPDGAVTAVAAGQAQRDSL